MFLLESNVGIIVLETVISVYLFSTYNDVKNGKEGNILKQWENRNKGKKMHEVENSFFGNVFKKQYPLIQENKYINDDFVSFINEFNIYIRTFIIALAIISFIYLIIALICRMVNKMFNLRKSHTMAPERFDGNQNARAWMESIEFYISQEEINNNVDKCATVLSRLSDEVKGIVVRFERDAKTDFKKLRNAFIKIYGGQKKTQAEYNLEFSSLVQGEKESLYHYYSELSRLADKAFSGLSNKIKTKFIDERFMLGLSNDALRTKLMETCKFSNFFDKIFAGKSILDKALELDEIYGSKKVDINLVQRYKKADGTTICYGCGEIGHYRNKCPGVRSSQNQSQNNQKSTMHNQSAQSNQNATQTHSNHVKIRAVKVSEEMTGYCNVDGVICKFLADTGAQRTVIDVSVLGNTNNISPCLFKVQLTDKSEATVLGVKKCLITLGYHTIQVEAIVTKNVSHNCFLGLDFLNKCPTTKIHLEGLQGVINDTKTSSVNQIATEEESFNVKTMLSATEESDC